MKSILQNWVMELGLRQQGVLLSAVRGCDNVPKNEPSKIISRYIRGSILNAHCGDNSKASSFISEIPLNEYNSMEDASEFLNSMDHYPLHFVMHLLHAAEVLGYYHTDYYKKGYWKAFYLKACQKLHLNPESQSQLSDRLDASEDKFKDMQ